MTTGLQHSGTPPKVLLATYGSVGDVRPIAALGQVLQSRGLRIGVCAPPDSRALIAAQDLPFIPLGGNVRKLMQAHARRLVARPLAAAVPMTHLLRRELERQFRQLPEVVAGADLVVGSGLALAVSSVAEACGVPYTYAVSMPLLVPSRCHAPLTVPWQNLPPLCNRMLWWMAAGMLDLGYRSLLNRCRQRLGLTPLAHLMPHLTANMTVAADRELAPLPPEAPPDCRQTGYWHSPPRDQPLPVEVEGFLGKKPKPIYIGFGSMGDPAPQRTIAVLRQAVRRSGQRAIIQSGWAGWTFNSDAHCLCVPHALPHDRLFCRVAAAVHHGGAGTVMTAARAGIPQVLVPHLLDQYYWGRRVQQLGIGPRPLDRKRLDVDRLTRTFERLAGSAALRANARNLAAPLRRRDGVGQAARWIVERIGG